MFRSWASVFYKVMSAVAVVLIAVTIGDLLKAKPFNVIILTIDSLRSSDFTPQTSPHFFAAMKNAASPAKHRAVSAWTAPNMISILTGMSPFDQGVHARGQFLPENINTPLEQLAEKGWKVGNVQAFALTDVFKNIGVNVDTQTDWKSWLAGSARQGQPFVFWYHYLDVHLPYSPVGASVQPAVVADSPQQQARIDIIRTRSAIPVGSVQFEDQDRALIRDLYLGGIQEFDNWFVGFWQFFKETGLDRDTIVIVTADHGEERLERGRVGHASTTHDASLHEEIVSIPLLIHLPQRHPLKQSGFRLGDDVMTDHLDIMPTLYALLDVTPSAAFPGRDLTVDQHPRPWFGYSSKGGYGEPDPDNISTFVAAVMLEKHKLIVKIEDGHITPLELYDLAVDPFEKNNLINPAKQGTLGQRSIRVMGDLGFGRLTEKIMSARKFVPDREDLAVGLEIPTLLWPKAGEVLGYDDLRGRFAIEWSGSPAASYVLNYEIGAFPFSLSGEMRVSGTRKTFGEVDRHYWNTWVVPYGKARVRIRQEGGTAWSQWHAFSFHE